MLYRGANLVPIAVLQSCLSVFSPNVNINATSAKSIIVAVDTHNFPIGF